MFYIQESATTKDIPFKSSKVIEFDSEMTMSQALHSLADHGILSAPVWDNTAKKYLGLIDVSDLLMLAVGVDMLVQVFPPSMREKKPKVDEPESTLAALLADNELTQQWVPVVEGTSLREVVKLLSTKARRVPVLSAKTGRVVQIISQSQISTLLNEYEAFAQLLTKQTLAQSGFGLKPVFTVTMQQPARDAFQLMVEHGVSSVCVVDETSGEVVTAMSTKDIRLLPRIDSVVTENALDLSCQQFVSQVRQSTDIATTHVACAVVDLDATLHMVLGKLAATKMHRVYVIDARRKPVGVISVSDVVVALQSIQPKD